MRFRRPASPARETWKDKNNAWQTGGGAFYVTGSYDPATNVTYWGAGNPTPKYDSSYRPGDNLFTNSALAIDAATGKIRWYHQYTPNDTMDYDETGTHILIDSKVAGEDRKLLAHAGRNGFFYSFDRLNGQFLKATQYVPTVTWTKGIDPKTGRPLDYDPGKDLQTYAEAVAKILSGAKSTGVCPGVPGGSNFWSAAYSERTGLVYVPELEGCTNITRDQTRHVRGKFDGGDFGYDGRLKSGMVVVDPATGDVVKRKEMAYANTSGALATAGGLIVTALHRRHRGRARRPDARGAVELQCGDRHQCATDDLCGRRPAVHRDRDRPHPQLDGPSRDDAGEAQSRPKRDDDLRVRAVEPRSRRRRARLARAARSMSSLRLAALDVPERAVHHQDDERATTRRSSRRTCARNTTRLSAEENCFSTY